MNPAISNDAERATPRLSLRLIDAGQERLGEVELIPRMNVGHALAALGVSVGALDRVAPSPATPVREGMTVRVTRVTQNLRTRREPIPAEVRYQPTTSLAPGVTRIVQYPQAGAREITERVWFLDGKPTRREEAGRRVVQAPQHRIVALGTSAHLLPHRVSPHRRYALSARSASPRDRQIGAARPNSAPGGIYRVARTLSMESTGYAAGRAGGALSNWTATGVRCTYGAVAVDPRVIPLGTLLYIEGYGYGFACDTGSAIRGHKIDLAFDSPRAAFAHGRRRVTVHVLAP